MRNLISDWKVAHKFWSLQATVLLGILQGVYGIWTAFQDLVSVEVFVGMSVFLCVAIIALRLINQPGVPDE